MIPTYSWTRDRGVKLNDVHTDWFCPGTIQSDSICKIYDRVEHNRVIRGLYSSLGVVCILGVCELGEWDEKRMPLIHSVLGIRS